MRFTFKAFVLICPIVVACVLSSPGPLASAEPLMQSDVFVGGKGGFHTYRVPSLITTKKGTLLAFCEGRKTSRSDDGDNDLMLRRSTDGGKTWQPMQLVHEEGGRAIITIGNPCPVVDQSSGVIWLTMNRKNDRILVTSSKDDGRTWAKPVDITRQVKKPAWGWYAMGPGVGIQLRLGPHKGRLIIPCDHRKTKNRSGPSSSHVVYSDDHGKTWRLGGLVGDHSNECQVAELSDGTLLLNARNHYGRSGNRPDLAKRRIISTSRDGGLSWSKPDLDETLIEPTCEASLIRYPRTSQDGAYWLLFSNPASKVRRERMTVRLSYDDGKTWPVSKLLYKGSAAYSCLTVLPDGRIGVLYERDNTSRITFAVFTLDWLRKP